MLDTARSVDPNALILTETESPTVIHQCQKMGYKPFSADKAARMKYGPHADEFLHENPNTQFFVYDLADSTK